MSEKGLAFLVNHSIPDDKVRSGTHKDYADKRSVYWIILTLAVFTHKTVMSDICQHETRLSSLDT
jgi:hypothetical protein